MPATSLITASALARASAEFTVDGSTGPALLLGRRGDGTGGSGWRCAICAKLANGSFQAFDELNDRSPSGMLPAYGTYRLETSSNCVVDRA